MEEKLKPEVIERLNREIEESEDIPEGWTPYLWRLKKMGVRYAI